MKTLKRNPWYIAAGCFLQMFLGMGLCSSFSMMLPEISAHTGISTGSISGNLTVAYLASFIVSMFFFKPLLRKFGAKKLLIFGDLLLMFHYILYSYAETIWFLRICGTLGGVLGVLAWCGSVPDFPAGDPLTALAVGIVSGLAATGTNQLIRQLKQPE